MRVQVLCFGVLREVFHVEHFWQELPEGSNVAGLLDHCRATLPEQGRLWDALAVAVNREYAQPADMLNDGDEVALLPPVSGGLTGKIGRMRARSEYSALLKDDKRCRLS